MLNLLINSLRMRPDRIILGEMRKKEQAQVLFEAMHTGHSVYSTVHADSASETIKRLTNPPIEVPQNLLSAVSLNLVMFRDRRQGLRRVYQIAEFLESDSKTAANIIYRWKADTDKFIPHNKPIKLFEDLSNHTSLTLQEIKKDLKTKERILDHMVKNNIRKIEDVGKIIKEYYTDEKNLLKQIKK